MANKVYVGKVALDHLTALQEDPGQARVYKAVLKTLSLMEVNLRHPSLCTHEFTGLKGPEGKKVFEAYVQQKTSRAYRIFWYYGNEKNSIFILAIAPHPD